jgi:uncharacterized membrane protein
MDWLVPALRLGGVLQLVVVSANWPAVRMFDYAGNLAGATRVFRQIFWVHVAWVVLTVVFLAALDLWFAEALVGGHAIGTFASGVLACLWGGRLAMQTLVYDRELRRQHRLADAAFVLAFVYLTGVHAVALVRGLSGSAS